MESFTEDIVGMSLDDAESMFEEYYRFIHDPSEIKEKEEGDERPLVLLETIDNIIISAEYV